MRRSISWKVHWYVLLFASEGKLPDYCVSQGEPYTFTLTDKDDDEKKSTVVVEARYVPVPITLEARESVSSKSITI